MSRASASFQVVKGEDFSILWTVQTSASSTTPVDISGWTFALKVKRKASDADPSVITPTITIVTAASGTVRSSFAASDTALLDGDYVYALWRTNSGAAACLATGLFSVIDTTQN